MSVNLWNRIFCWHKWWCIISQSFRDIDFDILGTPFPINHNFLLENMNKWKCKSQGFLFFLTYLYGQDISWRIEIQSFGTFLQCRASSFYHTHGILSMLMYAFERRLEQHTNCGTTLNATPVLFAACILCFLCLTSVSLVPLVLLVLSVSLVLLVLFWLLSLHLHDLVFIWLCIWTISCFGFLLVLTPILSFSISATLSWSEVLHMLYVL